MSVTLMSFVFNANLKDLAYSKDGQPRVAKASTAKLVLLAYADHANDEGESTHPSYTRLERKTALSRQGISDTLEAITQNDLMQLVGVSRRGTNDYKINIEKLQALCTPIVFPEKGVKPLDHQESSHLTTRSQATRLESSLTIPKHPIGAKAPVANVKKGDMLDGMLMFGRMAEGASVTIASRISEYPPDVQQTIGTLAELYNWPAAAIPPRPSRGGKGGQYAQWINEARAINQVVAGHGRAALEATKTPCKDLSISHPGAVTWCLAGEIGKLAEFEARQARVQEAPIPDDRFTPPPPALQAQARKQMEALRGN